MVSEESLQEISVRCLLLELTDVKLLLPNTLVAEVTEYAEVKTAGNSPAWLSGIISWRGRTIPLVQFEEMLGMERSGRRAQTRMVVLNTLNNNSRIPFIAMEIKALPRLMVLKHGMLDYDENSNVDSPAVLRVLHLEGESMLVPDIDKIENMIESLGLSA